MPRPKRTRVASTRTVTKTASPAPVPASNQPAEPSSDIYDVSDREKGKAKQRRQSTRDKNPIAHAQTTSMQQTKALEAARQRRDSAMDRLENMTSTSSNEVIESIEQQSESSVELGRKLTGTPQQRRMADMSGLDLDDDEFDDLNTTFDTEGPASAQRSAETSTMTASVFKRRPRAGSFLNREEGYIRPSSRTGPNTPAYSSTFNIGLFKRRVREPSILGTAQKPPPQRIEPDAGFDSESESGSEHDVEPAGDNAFAPNDESTPLRRSKRHSGDSDVDAAQTSTQSPRANPRKRKSTEGHERRARSSPYENEPNEEAVAERSESDLSSPPSTPPVRQHSSRPITPIMDEELMAPPLSSGSSSGDSEIWPPLQALAKNRPRRPVSALRRTPVPNDGGSDISSPPSLTYSPNYREPSTPPRQDAKTKSKAASSKPEPKITTADLANLLPRRRRRNARAEDDSEGEVDISGLGNDDDELSYMDVRARRRPASRAGNSRTQNAAKGRPASRGKGKQAPTNTNRRVTITYGRTSDKENQGEEEDNGEAEDENGSVESAGDEESSQAMIARVGEELKNAARKFQEVDKWQLDYEEMTQSSSPRDAR
ncbi:hypothetical protein F5B19DRAFT_361111 [Rostrohypoxylon terebratum]|nr:hypothetical protein F5B19DRAFT_361111 [Rostrohypoxylon terebratum]